MRSKALDLLNGRDATKEYPIKDMGSFFKLDLNVQALILSFLSPPDLACAGQSCTTFFKLSRKEDVRKAAYNNFAPGLALELESHLAKLRKFIYIPELLSFLSDQSLPIPVKVCILNDLSEYTQSHTMQSLEGRASAFYFPNTLSGNFIIKTRSNLDHLQCFLEGLNNVFAYGVSSSSEGSWARAKSENRIHKSVQRVF